MDVLDLIRQEARANRTVLLTASELDGSVESREVEAYSLRPGATDSFDDRLFYYCLKKNGIRNSYVSNLISAELTGNTFSPRWPVEL